MCLNLIYFFNISEILKHFKNISETFQNVTKIVHFYVIQNTF